jgi:hypothetical protein
VSEALASKIFSMASQLHDFKGVDLDAHRKIAYLGEKTFRYDDGSESNQVMFNYTLNATASRLLQVFEGLTRQEVDLGDLQRTMRYDPLGVNDVLMQIGSDLDGKVFPEPQSLLPALDKLAANSQFVNIARQRARALADQIRSAR